MAVTYSEFSASILPAVRRASWGAIFIGVVITMVVQLLLGILGLAIGASVIDPMQEANPVDGIGMGAGIYWVISSMISLFAGGYAAGALTTVQNRRARTLHGVTVWGLATLFLFLTIGSGVGGLIGGAANMIGGGASMVGDAVSKVAPQAADAVQRGTDEADFDLDLSEWREKARQLLRDTGRPELQPDRLEEESEEMQQDIRAAASRAGQDPQRVDKELEALFDKIQREGRETLRAVDREALVNIVSERTGQSRQEAAETVENWEQEYQQVYQRAREEWDEVKAETEEKAREWGEQAAEGVAKAAWWTFFALLLGAVAAAGGANVGANRVTVVHEDNNNAHPRNRDLT
ncbi:hypothetical protein Q6D67_07960 [Haliea sp. E1-2-M8]|uniref:hypothetical protein n=1 Tax=Haliea sp. E1-2-M8 TaxID=3064706 RepID=UPI002721DEEE|nr:hypothetical protein [Haliea sp. E1-2-M8]MDO8861634.1 hypothetical protein [Haliea sp. E1-2-M8]